MDNFKKSPNRKYQAETLNKKENKVHELLKSAGQLKTQGEDKTLDVEINKAKKLANQILDLIKTIRKNQDTTMPFDIKTATALLTHYTGKEDETESFLEAIDILNEITDTNDKPLMIKFIKTRISGKARLALPETINSVEAIKDKLRQKFSLKISSDAILAQLRSTHQGNKKLPEYITLMESLASQLTRAFIAEKVTSGEAAEKLAEKFANQSFIDNLTNPETALILKASNLTKLSDLAAKAISIDKPAKANIMHFKNNSQRPQNSNWQSNNPRPNRPNYNNNWHNRQNIIPRYNNSTQPHSNFSNRFNQQPFARNNMRYQQNINSQNYTPVGRNNPNYTGYRQSIIPNRPNPTRQNVHCCTSGESQSPQHDAQPSQLGGAEIIGESTM